MKKIFLGLFLTILLSVGASALDSVEISSVGFDKVYPSYSEVVMVEKDGAMGAVDRYGNTVVPFEYEAGLAPDSEGNTVFYTSDDDGTAISVIFDKNGEVISTVRGGMVMSVADGIGFVISGGSYLEGAGMAYTVSYFDLESGEVFFTCDNVMKATGFSEGYAALKAADLTFVINREGERVFTDNGGLEPLAMCGDGKIPFCAEDEDFYVSYYIVDLEAKERRCISRYEQDSETNFKRTFGELENFESFFFLYDKDCRSVFSQNGVYIYSTENPTNFNIDYTVVSNGIASRSIDSIAGYNAGEKYIMAGGEADRYYVTLDGVRVKTAYEGVTAFSNGRAVVFTDTDSFVFVNEAFEEISERFDGVSWVDGFGDVVCAQNGGKYYFINLESQSEDTPDAPYVPSIPVTPSKPECGMENFVRINRWSDDVFPDVKASDWFLANVSLAYETGLMYGKESGFAPKDKLTLAQVITMAARLHSIYNTGEADFVQGDVWYEVYVDYCAEAGIIKSGEYTDYNRNATRSEFVRILSRSVPSSEFEEKNSVSSIPDVSSAHRDAASIFMFYRAGILAGSDAAHTFFPDSEITRAETAAILTRIIDKALRLSF